MKTLLNNGSTKLAGLNTMIQEKKAANVKALNTFDAATVILSHKQMTASGNPDVGSTTNKNTNQLALYFCPEIAKKALINHFNLSELTMGSGKYIGLISKLAGKFNDQQQFCTDNRAVWVTMINNDMVDDLINEMRNCDLTDTDNIKKIFWDLTVIYRMYQERIIDSAKKAYIVDILIAIENYRALSLQPVKHIIKYGDDDELEVKAESYEKLTEENTNLIIYKSTPAKELPNGSKRMFFRDPISVVQSSLAKYLEQLVNIAADIKVEMPEEEVQRLLSFQGDGPVADLIQSVKYGYRILSMAYREAIADIDREEDKDAYIIMKERYNKATDTLKILARQLLSAYSPEDAASIMQLIACSTADGFNQASTNQIALNLLTEEYMTSIVKNSAEVKVMGYKLLIKGSLNEGDEVEFINGVSDCGAVMDFKKEIIYATGTFKIQKFNGSLYAVQDIKFDIPKADFTKRVFFVRPEYNMNLDVIIDGLKEGSKVTVKRDGSIKKQDAMIGEVKFEGNGEGIEKLLGVYGEVSYLKIVELEGKAPLIMFELSNIEVLEPISTEDDDIEIEEDFCVVDGEDDGIEIEVDEDIDFDDFDENGFDGDIEIEIE